MVIYFHPTSWSFLHCWVGDKRCRMERQRRPQSEFGDLAQYNTLSNVHEPGTCNAANNFLDMKGVAKASWQIIARRTSATELILPE